MSVQAQSRTRNRVQKIEVTDEQYRSESLYQKGMRRLRRDRLTMFAMGVIGLLALLAILAPVITNNILQIDPNKTDPRNNFLPFGSEGHILGTDDIGRDQLARLLHAGRLLERPLHPRLTGGARHPADGYVDFDRRYPHGV